MRCGARAKPAQPIGATHSHSHETAEGYYQRLEKAELVRTGRDTACATRACATSSCRLCSSLRRWAMNPEVIDLISLKPFNMELSSSARASRRPGTPLSWRSA
ncbi:g4456 [Coccomyxa viridis]|uniref:G4456 protein n=1 Tax=Coccomyxa viridis TaxID=1274662 RepID=A0ABP1FUB4_9CHLO